MLRYPDWLENWFYIQLTSEIRTEKGWENTRKRRNEAFDLCYYAMGIVYRPMETGVPYIHFGLDRMDMTNPPTWFEEWDRNEFVFGDEQPVLVKKKTRSLSEMASRLA